MRGEASRDRDLVARFISGDVNVFAVLHRRYSAGVYRLAFLRRHNEQEAEDITSETFYRAFQRLHQYEFMRCDSICPWLHRIAIDISVDRCRDKSAGVSGSISG